MKKTKRNIAIIVVLLFVCAAIYFNWSYNTQWGKADAEMAAAEDAATALRRYEELRKVYEAGGTQVLCVPGHPPFYALFTALTLEAQGDGRVLDYAAQFLEGGELL